MKKNTIFRQLIFNLLLPTVILFLILSVTYIRHSHKILNRYSQEKKYILVEKLKTIIEFEDIALAALEEELTEDMKEFSDYLVSKRFANTKNIRSVDLDTIRKLKNIDYDIYVIDTTGEIINTTFKQDLGFNLSKIDNEHKKFLQEIFKEKKFVSERLSLEAKTGKQKKYTYQSTLDNNYIIELGSYSPRASHLLDAMNNRIQKLINDDKLSLVSIDLFISKENKKAFNSAATIDNAHIGIFEHAFNKKATHDTLIVNNGKYLLYDYIYFKREQTDLYNESVLRIVSDITKDTVFARQELIVFSIVLVLFIILLFILFYSRAKTLTRPITKLVEQIKQVETGDFSGRVEIKGNNEITDLSLKFNIMLSKLEALYNSLESKVKERTLLLEEQKLELEEQAAELEKLSIVASETDSVVIIMDKYGAIQWVNAAFERTYGYNFETMCATRGNTIFEISDNKDIQSIVNECLKKNESIVYKTGTENAKGDKIWIHTTLTPINDNNQQTQKLIAIETDITQLIDIENKLKRAKIEAENANRAKSEFLANMSHEIRTPMNSIIGFSDLLDFQVTNESHKKYVSIIKNSSENLLNIINDILDLSKIEAGKIEIQYSPSSIHSVLNEIKNIFYVKVNDKNLNFELEISDNIPEVVLFDEIRLRQILLNLVGNAVKFTKNGFVKLSANCTFNPSDDNVFDLIISVEDSGIGIPKDSIDIIFDSFAQVDNKQSKKQEGTGLGLAITKRFVEMLNGSIQVKSVENQGSIFTITFNNVQKSSSATKILEMDKSSFQEYYFEDATILIADDIEENRMVIQDVFKNKNIHVVEAENGEKAIEQALVHKPDIILMDIRMPVMNGYAAFDAMRRDHRLEKIPVIAITAAGMQDEKEKLEKSKFDGILIKPVRIADLFHELSKFLKQQTIVKP